MLGSLLVVVAHPDDETFSVGGTMAQLVERGHRVTVVCATRGEAGEIADPSLATPDNLGAVREAELREAMAVLGVDAVRFLDYRDSGMAGTPDNEHPDSLSQAEQLQVTMELTGIMQELNPDVVITWDPHGGYGHPDHITVHHATTEAFRHYRSRTGKAARLYYMVMPVELFRRYFDELRALGEPINPTIMQQALSLPRLPITTVIDVSGFVARKNDAVSRHRTQFSENWTSDRFSEGLTREFSAYERFHRAEPAWPEGAPVETSVIPT